MAQYQMPDHTIPFDRLAEGLTPDTFDDQAPGLVARLDRRRVRVVFDFPRKPLPLRSGRRVDPMGFYRQEVLRIPAMDREEEIRFCMALEILWRRLQKARRAAGFSAEDAARYPSVACDDCPNCPPGRERAFAGCIRRDLAPAKRERLRLRHEEFVTARNELIARNLNIVFRLLDRYRKVSVAPEDMIQEANLSLFRAVEGFDFRRGVRFKTYAGYWVNQAFLNAIYNQSRVVRVPAYIQKAMKKIHDARGAVADLADTAGLAEATGVAPELVQTAIAGNRFTLSLDKTVDGESGARMVDLIEGGEEPEKLPDLGERARLGELLEQAFAELNERERRVLQLRYGLGTGKPATLAAVGQELGISLERVRQIQKGALEKLRLGGSSQLLEQFA
ncbi:MAG: sigma-70 family RNA polymerase sigma factor [Planctomycetota bacterium]|nr:MAG: sigma-70 family RNA polymerase sigma factor [Planctomycetota bacterium]